jgi:hypothetical protein
MIDISPIERELRRVLHSHQSIVQRTAMVDRLCQQINSIHAVLPDDQARSQFRAAYRAFVENSCKLPATHQPTNQTRLKQMLLNHAKNLKDVGATTEKLNRELGDF